MGLREELGRIDSQEYKEAFDRYHERPFDEGMISNIVSDNAGYEALLNLVNHIRDSIGEDVDPKFKRGLINGLGAIFGTIVEVAEVQALEESF